MGLMSTWMYFDSCDSSLSSEGEMEERIMEKGQGAKKEEEKEGK